MFFDIINIITKRHTYSVAHVYSNQQAWKLKITWEFAKSEIAGFHFLLIALCKKSSCINTLITNLTISDGPL